jgi:indoleamine 2,3-dioxygenase
MLDSGPQDGAGFYPERGFLPPTDPLTRLDSRFAAWEETAAELPKLLVSNRLRRRLANLPRLSIEGIDTPPQQERAMLLLSYLGHAYVWGERTPPEAVPTSIAAPWYEVAQLLHRPPILSYASYALNNWKRLDASGPVEIGNLCLLQNFWGGADEEWFVIIHVDIEMRAGTALRQLQPAQEAVASGDVEALTTRLESIRDALQGMYSVLLRMPDLCDPYIYYRRVRPYIFGWKDHPAIPDGLLYDGVAAYGDRPQRFRGETGAQSSIIPALDAVLGVRHAEDPLRSYLLEMRDYMPVEHRRFIASVEAGPPVRDLVLAEPDRRLVDAYDECVELVRGFRAKHLEYAATYIQHQAQAGATNPTEVGTGGTPFMRYLKKHRDETAAHAVPRPDSSSPPP